MKSVKDYFPSDAHTCYTQIHIIDNWRKYFPGQEKCPPIIYFDLWPVISQPLIWVVDPDCCVQFTQESPQPRHDLVKWALIPLTDGKDIVSMDMAAHRIWRSRLNPGFGSRNIMSNMPALLEETVIFARGLKELAGRDGNWGEVFLMQDKTTSFTFDIIMRMVM